MASSSMRVGSAFVGALLTVPAANAADYVIAGPSATLTPGSGQWSWDGGTRIQPLKEAIENDAYFGAAGTVPIEIDTLSLAKVDANSLASVDAFAATWWWDQDTPLGVAQAIIDFFLAGGDLILFQDSPTSDFIGELLGVPTAVSDGSTSFGGNPLHDGPFGVASQVLQWGATGRLDPGHVLDRGGHVASINASGEATAAIWNAGEFAPTAGRLLIVADVDMVSSATATYEAPLNDNARFALNGIAFATGAFGTLHYYGQGCPGTGGIVPTLIAAGAFVAGQPMYLVAGDALGGSDALVLFGSDPASTPIGSTGCFQLIAPVLNPPLPFLLGGVGAGKGGAILVGVLPPDSSGFTFACQLFVKDPVAPTGFSASRGVQITISE